MNLDRLRPAWEQFKLFQHFNPITEAEILAAIGRGEVTSGSKHVHARILQNVIIALFLLLFCQGG